jgi:hypothetical protein
MKLTEPLEQGLLHFKTRLVFPPLASQTSIQGVPGPGPAAEPPMGQPLIIIKNNF